eukprot:6213686-Pleurochrysis_carterae.AAC.1
MVLIAAGYHLPCSSHANQTYAHALELLLCHPRATCTQTFARAWMAAPLMQALARTSRSQRHERACSRLRLGDTQPVMPAAARAYEGTFAWDNQAADYCIKRTLGHTSGPITPIAAPFGNGSLTYANSANNSGQCEAILATKKGELGS